MTSLRLHGWERQECKSKYSLKEANPGETSIQCWSFHAFQRALLCGRENALGVPPACRRLLYMSGFQRLGLLPPPSLRALFLFQNPAGTCRQREEKQTIVFEALLPPK